MSLLLSALITVAQATTPAPTIRPDWLQFTVRFGVVDGQTGSLINILGDPVEESFSIRVLQYPEGVGDADYSCTLTWDSPATTPVDSSAWPRLWQGAAWRVDTSGTPEVSGNCANLDPARFGDDPAATIAGTQWYVGIGPLIPSVASACRSGDTRTTLYVWMQGAAPMPMGDLEVDAVNKDGVATFDGLPGAATAKALPDGYFSPRCSLFAPT